MDPIERGERAAVRQRLEIVSNGSAAANGRADGIGLRDELAEIGERIKGLQAQLSGLTPGAQPPPPVVQLLWSLLWQLRPFLFLATPAAERQWQMGKGAFQRHHRRHYAKDAAHVAIALRLYLVLVRFTVICPAAALHGCVTLLSVLSVVNDSRLRSWRDSWERLQDVFVFLLRALHTSDASVVAHVAQVMEQLLSEVTTHFDEVPVEEVDPTPTALYLDLSVLPSPALLAQADTLLSVTCSSSGTLDEQDAKTSLLHDAFAVHVCVETPYEARCIQAGLLQLFAKLMAEQLPPYMPRSRVVVLCDVACRLVSSGVPGAEGGVVNRAQHEAAWHTIHCLTEMHHLLPHVHGPLLLSLLLAQWQQPAAASISGVTVAELGIFHWLTQLTEAELMALLLAMERKGTSGAGMGSSVTSCLAQMWEIAVRWCVQLYSVPSTEASTEAALRLRTAMTTLAEWVALSEKLFRCSVQLGSGGSGGNTEHSPQNVDGLEYEHRLQLLASELHLPSITASLLCAQLPLLTVDLSGTLVFLPRRILSFLAVPALPAFIATVVEETKNCVDVSAYRLLDANALAVLSTLPTSASTHIRSGAEAFRSALEETIQVIKNHESPTYPLLMQALVVLLHSFPPDSGDEAAAAAACTRSEVIPRAVQGLDAALTERLAQKSQGLVHGVPAPLWRLLYREAACALFRVGSGLSWSRKALTLPTSLDFLGPHGGVAEAFVSRVAGITEGLHDALARSLAAPAQDPSGSNEKASMTLPTSLQYDEQEGLACLRRAYEGVTNLLSIALQLVSVWEGILRSVERSAAAWRGVGSTGASQQGGAATLSSGAVVVATSLLRISASLELQLLEAKYAFATLAGAEEEPAVCPAAALPGRSRSRGGKQQRSPRKKVAPSAATAAGAAVVVDVDDDGDEPDASDGDEETTAAAGKADHGSTSRATPAASAFSSRAQLLERVVEVHRSHLLPAVLSTLRTVMAFGKSASSSAGGRDAVDGQASLHGVGGLSSEVAATASNNVQEDDVIHFQSALLRFALAAVAFTPPAALEGNVRACFALHSLAAVDGGRGSLSVDVLLPLAAREVMLWSSHEAALNGAQPTTAGRFLLWLAATDKVSALSASRPDTRNNATAAADAAQDTIDLLWFVRRCFQDVRTATTAATHALDDPAAAASLSGAAMRKQGKCLVACEFAAHEARGWLSSCFDLYNMYRSVRSELGDTALTVMGLCIEAARDVMTLYAWSATDLLRFRERPFVFSSFLKSIVDKEDRDMKVVLTASLDVLGRYLISADADITSGASGLGSAAGSSASNGSFVPGSETTRERLRRLLKRDNITEWSSVAGAFAYVLYECSGKPLAKQMQYLAEVAACVDKTVRDIPAMVRASKHMIAFHIVSLEADAQLVARDQRRRSGRERRSSLAAAPENVSLAGCLGRDAQRLFSVSVAPHNAAGGTPAALANEEGVSFPGALSKSCEELWVVTDEAAENDHLDSICFSVFERAVEQMVTLCETTDSSAAVEAALRKPVSRAVAVEELWKSMFAVLDSIYKAIRIEPAARYGDDGNAQEDAECGAPGSLRTRRRWLLGLASFIRLMGPQTTPIALMLPTLLERCSQLPSLVPFVCLVWKELVCACTEEYLAESAPSIALSLVSLERHAAPQAESRRLLVSTLHRLHKRTESAPFWDSYKVVLGSNSALVSAVLRAQKPDEERRAFSAAASGEEEGEESRAMKLLAGFVEVMRSGSLQSTTVFVRALHQYLSLADTTRRLQLSRAAAHTPALTQTLLRCAEADAESAVCAMRCLSILGAVNSSVASTNACGSDGTVLTNALGGRSEGTRSSLSLADEAGIGARGGAGILGGLAAHLDAETVLNWRKFAFTLLMDYFPRVFASTADPVMHNCIAFAVQELIRAATTQERLQHKGVKLRAEDVVHVDELERYAWWMRLTPHVKQLLGGFTTTRYSLTVNWKTRLRVPEYTAGLSYRRWLFSFFNHLVASCEGWFAEMVQPLRNVAKHNSSLILFLLPYLVVHLLESGKLEDEQYLEAELKAVLEAVVGGPSHAALSLRSQSLHEAHPDAAPQHEPREHAHTVLIILEDLEQLRWSLLRHRGRVTCVFDPQQQQSENACVLLSERYGAFVRLIPWTLRCRAALKIGSHIRALRSVEGQRRIPALTTFIQTVPLQRIFAALGDRESSRSIHRATPGLSLEDTAFSFENNGDWLAALGSAELVLQHRPSSGQHQLTALRCMNELGELYMTSQYAASLLASPQVGYLVEAKPAFADASRRRASTTFSQLDTAAGGDGGAREESAELRSHVQAYANEAAWRLGQWETLLPDELSSSSASSAAQTAVSSSVSLALPAAFLHRELIGRCALPRARAVTDVERLKIVPMVRTPCQEDLTTQGNAFTLVLHALGDVDAVSDLLCANISFLEKGGRVRHEDSTQTRGVGSSRSTPRRISAALLPSAVKDEIISFLTTRQSYVEDTISAREPLLSLHRMIYRELAVPQKVAETWLQQSELLRNAGLGEAALTAARQAAFECPEHIVHTNYYTLVADLLHDTQSATPAIEFARECVGDQRIPAKTRGRVQMLLTNWLVETGSERPEHVFAEYEKALALDRSSELVHYRMAVFYDHLYTLATNASESAVAQLTTTSPAPASGGGGAAGGGNAGGGSASGAAGAATAALYSAVLTHQRDIVELIKKYAVNAIEHFGKALLRGTEKASVSLPRMLTLWLDSAAFLGGLMTTTAGKLDSNVPSIIEEMNTRVRTFILSTSGATIPPGVVMTALPQLLSRLTHAVLSVRAVLTDVVVYLLNCFPQQCLWLVLPMTLSKEGPKEIVETQIIKPFADNSRNEGVLRYAKIICDSLLTICNCSASLFPKEQGLTELSPVQKLNPMLPRARFVLPVLSNLTPDITAEVLEGVFATTPCFNHFKDRVTVMQSLQRPKRIWVATDDGREISFLCKSKDEPRKDIRMMEMATLMNSFFLSDPTAKRKRFSLRRYSVTALSDDCAVIEWLNDTTTLARVAMECYSLDRSGVHISSVKKWVALVDEKKLSKMDLFTKYILPEAPPVLHQWLDRSFASNQSWYEARTLFTQSTALWSIAGHIVGLGDRHAENLMLDMERGELVHVDFACMFDKGEKLEVPEQVRFRLTQNLTDAMGVLGAYGPFQATCEIALRCEMNNKSAVMSIVETLLHEPLVEWRRQSARQNSSTAPKRLMERVARRLDGFLDLYSTTRQRDTLALNVESQVSKLIHHSSDLNNLSQMYIWWMAWI